VPIITYFLHKKKKVFAVGDVWIWVDLFGMPYQEDFSKIF
jgi:hypothetical protein